jgi:hypothetical protein
MNSTCSPDRISPQEATADFSHELIRAARSYAGKDAIYHQDFAGNCIEFPSDNCFSDGIGPQAFDCSGLIVRSMSDVLDVDPIICMKDLRHVRDMWRAAYCEQDDTFDMAELAVGALLVTRRRYDIGGESTIIPGHIGIITDAGGGLGIIHTNLRRGRVEETALPPLDTALECVTMNVLANQRR